MSTYQPAGNYYDKYNTDNPIAKRLMDGFLASFGGLVDRCDAPATSFEVGCGEAELSIRLAQRGIRSAGIDIAPDAITEARERIAQAGVNVAVDVGSIYELDASEPRADLVVCCEVLEHLEDTQAALDVLHGLTGSRLIVSVPREPIWRVLNMARGKYWGDWGNTPGHVQHWSSKKFVTMLESRFRVVEVRKPLPWTMVLLEPKR